MAGPPAPLVLTPHPGEFARLTGEAAPRRRRRRRPSRRGSRGRGALGAGRRPQGRTHRGGRPGGEVLRSDVATPALATAGSGDVLAGAIGAFLAAGATPLAAAACGVAVHGAAGVLAAERIGTTGTMARDLASLLPEAIARLAVGRDPMTAPAARIARGSRSTTGDSSNLAALRIGHRGAEVIAVVKANAYGHGDVAVARTLVAAGVERLAVATVDEGRAFARPASRRRSSCCGASARRRRRSWRMPGSSRSSPTVARSTCSRAAERAERSASTSRSTRASAARARRRTRRSRCGRGSRASPRLRLGGTMSHLAVPGEDDAYTEVQLLRLARVVDAMRSAGIDPGLVHVSATGGILAGVSNEAGRDPPRSRPVRPRAGMGGRRARSCGRR